MPRRHRNSSSPGTDNAWIITAACGEFRTFSRMQDSSENLDTIHNTRPWSREIRARVYQINLAATRRRK
jgi:hypothetical protein